MLSEEQQPLKPASAPTVISLLLIPMVLIFFNTGLNALASYGTIDADAAWVRFFVMLGQTPIALLITVLIALVVLGLRRGVDKTALENSLIPRLARSVPSCSSPVPAACSVAFCVPPALATPWPIPSPVSASPLSLPATSLPWHCA